MTSRHPVPRLQLQIAQLQLDPCICRKSHELLADNSSLLIHHGISNFIILALYPLSRGIYEEDVRRRLARALREASV
jgi:hypothetical protein